MSEIRDLLADPAGPIHRREELHLRGEARCSKPHCCIATLRLANKRALLH